MKNEKSIKYYNLLLFIAILFVGATLRSPISSVGPLVPFFKEELIISNGLIGLMNTLPLIAFGLFSPIIPKLSQKLGMERVLIYSMLLLVFGMWIRVTAGAYILIFGTIIIGIAISVGNVMGPGLIKSSFPGQVGFVTGMYSVTMNLVSALAAGLSVPIALSSGFNWRIALQIWLVIPVIAIIIFLLRFPYFKTQRKKVFAEIEYNAQESVWKSKLAWAITIYMGLQSFIPYSLFAWLPTILASKGFSESEAGWLVTLNQIGLIPVAFVIPIIASKMHNQSYLAIFGALSFLIGLVGVGFFSNSGIVVYMIFLGIGAGTTYSLAMMLFVLRTNDVQQSYQLSGMSQSIGYLMASLGPFFIGLISDLSHSWTIPLVILIVISVLVGIFGVISGQPFKVNNKSC